MARTTRITYGQCLVLASPRPANQSNIDNLTGLKRIYSANIDFSFNRQRYKQIGSADYIGDVNLTNPNVELNLGYLFSNGTNEITLGLNVDGNAGCVLSGLRATNVSNNFYLVYGSGTNDEVLLIDSDDDFVDNYSVAALGDCHLNSYTISCGVGKFTEVNAVLQADNLQMRLYQDADGYTIPAIDPATKYPSTTNKFKLKKKFFQDTTNQDGLINSAITSSGIKLTLPSSTNIPGLELTGNNQQSAFIDSFELSFDINRTALYGFGSIYPFGRRAILPILGKFNFNATASEFQTGALENLVRLDNNEESAYPFIIDLYGQSGNHALSIEIENAKFDAESIQQSIDSFGVITCSTSFSISDASGLKFSTPPLILTQPQDTSGPSGPLTITATGKTPFSYAWYTSDGSGPVSTDQTYPANAGDYYCVVTNQLGSATSNLATVV